MSKYQHFQDNEVEGLDETFVQKLDQARGLSGVPFVITSGLRSPSENKSLPNAVQDSAHLSGLAVDLAVADSQSRFLVVKALLDCGFNRIGIYSAHVHVDNSKTLPPNVMWYVEGA